MRIFPHFPQAERSAATSLFQAIAAAPGIEELYLYGENAGTNGNRMKRSSMIIHWILDEVITLCSDQNSARCMNIHA